MYIAGSDMRCPLSVDILPKTGGKAVRHSRILRYRHVVGLCPGKSFVVLRRTGAGCVQRLRTQPQQQGHGKHQ